MTWLVQSPRPRPSLLRHQGPLVATLPAAGRISKILGKKSSKWQPVYSVFILSSAFGVQVGFFWGITVPKRRRFSLFKRFSCVHLPVVLCSLEILSGSLQFTPTMCHKSPPQSQASGHTPRYLCLLGSFSQYCLSCPLFGSPAARLQDPQISPIRCASPWLPAFKCPNMHEVQIL